MQLVQCLSDPDQSSLMIDKRQVFATGFSNGAAMAGKLACGHSDVFSGAVLASQSFPYRQADRCRASANQCVGQPRVEDACEDAASGSDCVWGRSKCYTYDNCAGGTSVTQCEVDDDHLVFVNPQRFNICGAAWQRFQLRRRLRR